MRGTCGVPGGTAAGVVSTNLSMHCNGHSRLAWPGVTGAALGCRPVYWERGVLYTATWCGCTWVVHGYMGVGLHGGGSLMRAQAPEVLQTDHCTDSHPLLTVHQGGTL